MFFFFSPSTISMRRYGIGNLIEFSSSEEILNVFFFFKISGQTKKVVTIRLLEVLENTDTKQFHKNFHELSINTLSSPWTTTNLVDYFLLAVGRDCLS